MSHQRHLQIILVAGLVALSGCSRKVSGDEESARRLLKNASILLDQGRFTAARDSASKAEELFQGVRSDEGAGEAALMLGDLEGSVASFENAFKDYNASIQHYRNVGDRVGELAAQISTMDLYARMGREEEAFSRGEDLLRLARATHDNQGAGILGRALLPLARILGKKETVENLLKIQMQEAQSSADGKGIAWLRDQTGITQLSGGDAPLAVKTFTEARSLAEQARDSNLTVTILVHLGKASVAAGDIPGAITAFDDATQLADSARSSPSLKQEIFFRLGNVFLAARRPTESIRWFQSALTASHEPGDELARRYALLQMANALRLVNPSSALPILSQALDGLDEGSPASVVAYANGTAGLCELATNQPVAAAASFQKAVDAAEMQWRYPVDDVYADCEQSVVGRGKTPWHDEAIDLLLRMGKNDDALAIALRRSAWNLYRDLDRISPSVADQSLKALIDRWHVARARCNGAEEQLVRSWMSSAGARERAAAVAHVLAQTAADARSLAAEIVAARPALGCFVTPQAPSPARVQQMLPEGSQLVLYGTTSRSLQIFVVSKRTISTHSVSIDRSQLAVRCAAFMAGLGSLALEVDTLTEYQPKQLSRNILDQERSLYEVFLRPAERDFGQSQKLLFVESDELPFIPLGALRRNGMTGSSLIERLAVAYVLPSTMTGEAAPVTPVKDIIAFGSAGASGRDGEYEMRDIKASFNDGRFHFGRGVSLSTLADEHADLAHLVLDIHWDASRPANSFVSMPDPQSGVMKELSIGDFVRIPVFPTVVLHNLSRECSGAAGRLACIPFAAGSRIVVLNSSGTGRKSVKGFVDAFSTELATGKGVADAYRAAILGIIRKPDALPSFWVPYVLWNN